MVHQSNARRVWILAVALGPAACRSEVIREFQGELASSELPGASESAGESATEAEPDLPAPGLEDELARAYVTLSPRSLTVVGLDDNNERIGHVELRRGGTNLIMLESLYEDDALTVALDAWDILIYGGLYPSDAVLRAERLEALLYSDGLQENDACGIQLLRVLPLCVSDAYPPWDCATAINKASCECLPDGCT